MGSEKANHADVLMVNGLVLTMDEDAGIIEDGAVAVRDQKIVALGATRDLAGWRAKEKVEARGKLIMPGLVNAHTHLPMSLFRGLADDLPLEQWLHEHIFPAEAKFVTPESVGIGAQLSAAEMLLGGTTTCCDGYFLAHDIAAAIAQTGLRAVVGQGVIDFPAPGVHDPKENIHVAEGFVRHWRGRLPQVHPSIFCHAPYTCSSETLTAAKQVADKLGVLFQIHVAESRSEAEQCRQTHGCSPVQYLERLGLLNRQTLLVHAVWIDDNDIRIIAHNRAPVVHCPESNMKLASGVSPVPRMLSGGVVVGLGTDGCASNNDLDLWGEMDAAAKLHKAVSLDPTVMRAHEVLRMATITGARALGLDHEIGTLAVGKQADLIMIDLSRPHLTPMYHPESHLVYAAKAGDVSDTMIAGQWVMRNRQLLTIDIDALMRDANALGATIASLGLAQK